MRGHVYKPNCKCSDRKKCTCGATWAYIIDIGKDPKTGKRKQKKKGGFLKKKDAEYAMAQAIIELRDGTYIEESNITFKDFAADWLSDYAKTHSVKISTVRIRQHEINLLTEFFAYLQLKDIKKKTYQDALNKLTDKGYAYNTICGVHATGRMIFKKAREWELIKTDPTEFARVPRKQKTIEEIEAETEIPKYLEKEELALFLKTAREKGLDRDYIIFITLAYTGMRDGELCALQWKDIDFKEKTISITKTYYNPTNNTVKYVLLPPKTKKSKRVIEVDPFVINELEKYKAKQNELIMRHRDIYYDKGFIFAKTKKYPGYPEQIKAIENRMARLLKLAGLPPELTPHSLRHTHTSLLAEAGVSLPEIMDRLGHTDDDTTKNVYLHVTKAKKKEASRKFSELMRSL